MEMMWKGWKWNPGQKKKGEECWSQYWQWRWRWSGRGWRDSGRSWTGWWWQQWRCRIKKSGEGKGMWHVGKGESMHMHIGEGEACAVVRESGCMLGWGYIDIDITSCTVVYRLNKIKYCTSVIFFGCNRLQPVMTSCDQLWQMKILKQLQLLNETLGPNCNWKSSCYQLQYSWVAVIFQLVQLDLKTLARCTGWGFTCRLLLW